MNIRQKIRNGIKRITPICIFYKYMKYVFKGYRVYQDILRKEEKNMQILVCPWPGTGDAYQTGRYLSAYIKANDIHEYLLVTGTHTVKKVLEIFATRDIRVRCFDDTEKLSCFGQFIGYQMCGIHMMHHNPPKFAYLSLMKELEGIHGYTWEDAFRRLGLSLPDSVSVSQARFHTFRQTAVFKSGNVRLRKGKTVILSPYANTFYNIPMQIWTDLAKCLRQSGYMVCTNSAGDHEPVIPGTKRIFFSYRDSVAVCEYAGYFIGLRSGLCDIISSARCRKIILYQNIKCGWGNVLNLFEMNAMGICRDAIEFEVNDSEEIINSVLMHIPGGQKYIKTGDEKMEKAMVSVIIPAYNAEKFLSTCVKSVQAQQLNQLEIIIINNGSKDKTEQIIDELMSFDQRIKKINLHPNAGVANARNQGIKEAKGKYIVFADADDYVPDQAYKQMYLATQKKYTDVVVGDYYEVVDRKNKWYCSTNESHKEFVTFFAGGVIWNKMYRKEFLLANHIFFKKYNFGEDTLFLGDVYICNPVVIHLAKDVYHHLQRTNSSVTQLTRQYNAANLREYFACGKQVYTLPYQCPQDDVVTEYLRYLNYVYHFWWENPSAAEQKDTFGELQEFTTIFRWDKGDREQRFIEIFHVKPALFQKITYDTYMAFMLSYYHTLDHQYAPSIDAKEIMVDEYRNGKVGFRYIIRYVKGWLYFKLFGQ